MAENKDIVPSNTEQNESTAGTQQLQLLEEFDKSENDQKKLIKKMLENQMKILEKMETIQAKLDGRKRKLDCQGIENPVKKVVTEPPTLSLKTPSRFVIRNVFKDVSKMEKKKYYRSVNEEHFGVPWDLNICAGENNLGAYLHCVKSEDIGKWSIEIECDLKIVHPNGKSVTKDLKFTFDKCIGFGYGEFIKWEDLLKDYLMDDKLIVEAHVNINKMTGIYKDNLRSFDKSNEDFSDVVLNVKDEKFYVSKLYLANHSTYFKALFLGNFDESEKGEVILSGINSEDFQKYLEVLYGEYAIDEVTVEGILLLSDMYDTPIVTRKCEEFLLKKSKKTMKKKLQMAARYNLDKLKNKCLSKMETLADIRAVTPGDINDMDPSITSALLGKALSFE